MLDLRDNGGGLLNEAVLVSSIFIPEGRIVSTKGRSRPERVYEATGRRDRRRSPGRRARQPPVRVRVGDRHRRAAGPQARRRSSGTRTFGKGVFQEIEQLSNGGALDITVGEYFLPSGRNIGGGGVKKGDGIAPDVKAAGRPEDQAATRRSSRPSNGADRRGRREPDGAGRRARAARSSAVLERRGPVPHRRAVLRTAAGA